MIEYVAGKGQVLAIAQDLLKGVELESQKVRLLGITLSNLEIEADEPSYKQMELDLQLFSFAAEEDGGIDWI
jgi:hypothetical protein